MFMTRISFDHSSVSDKRSRFIGKIVMDGYLPLYKK